MKVVSVAIDEKINARLEEMANIEGISKSDILRRIITNFMREEK